MYGYRYILPIFCTYSARKLIRRREKERKQNKNKTNKNNKKKKKRKIE